MIAQVCLLLERVRIFVMSSVADALSTIVVHAWLKLKMHISMTVKVTKPIRTSTISATSITVDFEGHPIPALKSTRLPSRCHRTATAPEIMQLSSLLTFGNLLSIAIQISRWEAEHHDVGASVAVGRTAIEIAYGFLRQANFSEKVDCI